MKRIYPPPEVITEKCIGCGLCVELCPSFVLDMVNEKASVVRGRWCIGCGHCGAVCPTAAVLHEATAVEKGPWPEPGPATSPDTLLLLLRERRSVRAYRDEPVSDEIIERILDAGRYAPTGRNSQNVHYVVLGSQEEIAQLREMTMRFYEKVFSRVRGRLGAFLLRLLAGRRVVEYLQESIPKVEHVKELIEQGKDPLFYHAPAVMVVHAESWDTCSAFNCALALYNCSLMAHTLGVGCCFNGYLESAINNDRRIKKRLGIPREHRCFGAMTLGYQEVRYHWLVERDPAKVTWR
ncbi:MAG: nitroreductase family protein [Deltaproteobacteria bacterium]|nr:nitroreductase family protein [Deltaproteobacteria bacterium]